MDKLLEIKDVDPCVRECRKRLESIEEIQNVPEARALLDQVIQYKNQMYGKVQRKLAEVQIRLRERQTEREQLEGEIQRLKRKKLSYPEAVERLTEAVREEFQRLGRKAEPHVLCEVLEIADESWRNAVEGYLNTQRFYILVEPENFDIALGIYDRLRREKKHTEQALLIPSIWRISMKCRKGLLPRRLRRRISMPDAILIWCWGK